MYNDYRERQIRQVLSRLEQLVSKAEKDREESELQWGEDAEEAQCASAYEDGAFAAYAIVKRIFEGDYCE